MIIVKKLKYIKISYLQSDEAAHKDDQLNLHLHFIFGWNSSLDYVSPKIIGWSVRNSGYILYYHNRKDSRKKQAG